MTLQADVPEQVAMEISLPRFDPADPELCRNPYPIYSFYRERDPVHWGVATIGGLDGSWYVFRYDDNAQVLMHGSAYASDPATVGVKAAVPAPFSPVAHVFQRWLGGMDPPDHNRLRSVVASAFTLRRVAALRPRIEAIAAALVDEALDRGDGKFDLVRDVAFPLPMAVIGDALGVGRSDWRLFQGWAEQIALSVDQPANEHLAAAGAQAIHGMFDYFSAAIQDRRRRGGEDLLSLMVAATDHEGQPMPEFDAIAVATELGVAGHETTTKAIAKSVLGLMEQRERWEQLKTASDALFRSAVEELLRWSAPVQRQRWRWATRDTTLGGREVRRGDSVVAIVGAANRDPRQFPEPDRMEFARPTGRHLSFGLGTHYCIGASLARLELGLALSELVRKLPGMHLVEDPAAIEWQNNSVLPGPVRVLVQA